MISLHEIEYILENNDPEFLEDLVRRARRVTLTQFGRAVGLYAPLYLSDYCDNHCLYCGFRKERHMRRRRLTTGEIHREMGAISGTGIRNILLLTGESRKMAPVGYLKSAVRIAADYFSAVHLEVYPLEMDEYRELYEAGVDGVTLYQETYDRQRYKQLHPRGRKADYDFRFHTPLRVAASGMRSITMGILLGLAEIPADTYHLFLHVEWMQKKYPGVEYSLSFPRLIPQPGSGFRYFEVSDFTLIKLICLARILFPRVGINLSTREKPILRDRAVMFGVTRVSAASRTEVGGYTSGTAGPPQFDVQDRRSVREMAEMLNDKGCDPVFTDWRRIANEPLDGA